MTSHIAQNLNKVLQNIANVATASRPVTLVAVGKTKPASMLMECYNSSAAQRHFGENYVHELIEKAKEMPKDIHWHFIGHLQSNKVKAICHIPNLYMVQTVDRQKIAKALNAAIEEQQKRKLKVLIQVKTSQEETKSGCEPEELVNLCKYVINECPNLEFCGLMTIGDLTNSKSTADYNPDFEKLISLRDLVSKELNIDEKDLIVSMGMSSDYELAIKYGATLVRVGSTIFGEREYHK